MKKIALIDVDGTIAKVGDRLKYLQQDEPDWDNFYGACPEDEPIKEIIGLVDIISQNYKVVFCTGRHERVRKETRDWIRKYFTNIQEPEIIMRPNGDYRHDTEIKPEQLIKHNISLSQIEFVLEDRNSMVKEWRELGLKCLQVAEGDF